MSSTTKLLTIKNTIRQQNHVIRPSFEEAAEAVRTIIRWAGDDPDRTGLRDTPRRVLEGHRELFSGYDLEPQDILSRTFDDTDKFEGIVLLKNIQFHSTCEHHMLPIVGRVDVAYTPKVRVVGISKIARVVDMFARRLQLQERLTSQIAKAIYENLDCFGVAVSIIASHDCMNARGVKKHNALMQTTSMLGDFEDNAELRNHFLSMISSKDNFESGV